MKVVVSVDIEGATGIVSTKETGEGNFDYERARKYLTRDVNAVVEGALEGGATRVSLHDTHGIHYRNILLEDLHPAAELIRGTPIFFFEDLKAGWDACLLVACHASPGKQGVLSHLYTSTFREVRVNGSPVGEGAVTAAMAGQLGIPTVLATGDDVACEELKEIIPEIETAVVKYAITRYAASCLPFEKTEPIIKEAAKKALQKAKEIKPFTFGVEVKLEIDLDEPYKAKVWADLTKTKYNGKYTVEYIASDSMDVYRFLTLGLYLVTSPMFPLK